MTILNSVELMTMPLYPVELLLAHQRRKISLKKLRSIPLKHLCRSTPRTPFFSALSRALTVSKCPLPTNPPASTKNFGEAVEQTTSRKSRRGDNDEERDGKKRKLQINILVINLNVDDRIEFIKKKAE